jgi:hypothetical protein
MHFFGADALLLLNDLPYPATIAGVLVIRHRALLGDTVVARPEVCSRTLMR